jgi:hypothetical protein
MATPSNSSMRLRFAALLAPIALIAGTASADPAKETGFLNVHSKPEARVIIDGNDTQRSTPLLNYELPTGQHKLTLVTSNGKQSSLGFTIKRGETSTLRINFP